MVPHLWKLRVCLVLSLLQLDRYVKCLRTEFPALRLGGWAILIHLFPKVRWFQMNSRVGGHAVVCLLLRLSCLFAVLRLYLACVPPVCNNQQVVHIKLREEHTPHDQAPQVWLSILSPLDVS